MNDPYRALRALSLCAFGALLGCTPAADPADDAGSGDTADAQSVDGAMSDDAGPSAADRGATPDGAAADAGPFGDARPAPDGAAPPDAAPDSADGTPPLDGGPPADAAPDADPPPTDADPPPADADAPPVDADVVGDVGPAPDAAPDPCEGPDLCDGLDDDCDGRVDEDEAGQPCGTGADGRCWHGVVACAAGAAPVCLQQAQPADERCNAIDDDCDGQTDEGLDCADAGEVDCADGIDNDRDTYIDCRDFDCGHLAACADRVERCDNGVDDDADGQVDCADYDCVDHPDCAPIDAPECRDYVLLDDPTRHVGFEDGPDGANVCESRAGEVVDGRWHRFVGGAGQRLPTAPPPPNACGTRVPGFLDGEHPAVADGIVDGRVCFSLLGERCWESMPVRIRDCGPFYVYAFGTPDWCSGRYCGEGGAGPAPPAARVPGIQRDVPRQTLLDRGWRVCHRSTFADAGPGLFDALDGCGGSELLITCGRVDSGTLSRVAGGDRREVVWLIFPDLGEPEEHNGAAWYFLDDQAFGFGPPGGPFDFDPCDEADGDGRLCIRLGADNALLPGERCGAQRVGADPDWERLFYAR